MARKQIGKGVLIPNVGLESLAAVKFINPPLDGKYWFLVLVGEERYLCETVSDAQNTLMKFKSTVKEPIKL